MKVYVVRWFSAEPYEPSSGIHKVFYSRQCAERYLIEEGLGPHGVDLSEYNEGYFLSSTIKEYEVE